MKIAVAMSGGVDSSVVAAILKKEGHAVSGYTMQHYLPQKMNYPRHLSIEQSIEDAKRICEQLHIEHKVIHVEEDFESIVVNNFIHEYQAGRTPNPCTLCNPTIKWGRFLSAIEKDGMEKMATGHYGKIFSANNRYHLFRGEDAKRDQTYMLWKLSQRQLSKTLFPLANFSKVKTRNIAKSHNLFNTQKTDSQEICFIYGHYKDFLKEKVVYSPGPIVFAPTGESIGTHQGLPFYTIGQRKGLKTPWKSPLFVMKSDVNKNILYVTDILSDLMTSSFQIKEVNWISGKRPENSSDLQVQIRYNSNSVEVRKIEYADGLITVTLMKPAKAVTPGQSAVFYKENELIGGGIIL